MFCYRCGNQLRDGANFCGKCGAPAKNTSDSQYEKVPKVDDYQKKAENKATENVKRIPEKNPEIFEPEEKAQKSYKEIRDDIIQAEPSKKRYVIAGAVVVAFIILIFLIVHAMKKINSFSKVSSFSIPQAIMVSDEDQKVHFLSRNADSGLSQNINSDIITADNGLFAYITMGSEDCIVLYDMEGNQILKERVLKSGETYYYDKSFLLSGNGERLVYYSPDGSGFTIYNISNNTKTSVKVDGDFYFGGISYSGKEIVVNNSSYLYLYKEGLPEQFLNPFGVYLGMSDDGEYIYYYCWYSEESSDIDNNVVSDREKAEAWVYHNGHNEKITDLNPNYSVLLCALGNNGEEAIIWNDNSLYYFNAKTVSLKTIRGTSDIIYSFENIRFSDGDIERRKNKNSFIQNRILNAFYYSYGNQYGDDAYESIGYLNEDFEYIQVATLNAGNRHSFSISDDRTKLWCVNAGYLSYYEIKDKELITYESDLTVMPFDDYKMFGFSTNSATRDGSKACFVSGYDGAAYIVTPENISDPVKVMDNAASPTFSKDDQLYILESTMTWEDDENTALYKISDDNNKVFQYADVKYMVPTLSGMYIFVVKKDDNDYEYEETVMKERNGQFEIVSKNCDDNCIYSYLW